jgi:hypothetical protein
MLNRQEEAENLLVVLEDKYPEREDVINHRKSLLMAVKKDSTSALRFFEESGSGKPGRIILYSLLGKKDEALALMQDIQDEEGKNIIRSRYLYYKNLLWYNNLREDERFKKILEKEKERYQIILEKYRLKK